MGTQVLETMDGVSFTVHGLICCNSSSFCDWLSLPEDLWVLILCRLQDKELVMCKAVCKSWNDWISCLCIPKKFAYAHVRGFFFWKFTESNPERVMAYKRYSWSDSVDDQYVFNTYPKLLPFRPAWAEFIGCWYGLVLFIQRSIKQYYVCNPATKQFVAIPLFCGGVNFEFASLAFDPCISLLFKVVCFNLVHPFTCYIFSSETSRWDVHEIPFDYTLGECHWVKRSMYLGGVFYYVSEAGHLICIEVGDRVSASAIDVPEFDGIDRAGCIGVSKGYLCYSNHDCKNMMVWKLENRKWILMHDICLSLMSKSVLTGDLWQNPRSFMPFAFHPTANVLFFGQPRFMLNYHFPTRHLTAPFELWSFERFWNGHRNFWPYRRCLLNLQTFDEGSP